MVHKGFLDCWSANSLDVRVLQRVDQIIQAGKGPAADFKVLLAGGSLLKSYGICIPSCLTFYKYCANNKFMLSASLQKAKA